MKLTFLLDNLLCSFGKTQEGAFLIQKNICLSPQDKFELSKLQSNANELCVKRTRMWKVLLQLVKLFANRNLDWKFVEDTSESSEVVMSTLRRPLEIQGDRLSSWSKTPKQSKLFPIWYQKRHLRRNVKVVQAEKDIFKIRKFSVSANKKCTLLAYDIRIVALYW